MCNLSDLKFVLASNKIVLKANNNRNDKPTAQISSVQVFKQALR